MFLKSKRYFHKYMFVLLTGKVWNSPNHFEVNLIPGLSIKKTKSDLTTGIEYYVCVSWAVWYAEISLEVL